MSALFALFESLPWWKLRPEPPGSTLVDGQGDFGSRDWASTARDVNGRLVVIYAPSARDLTVNLARLSGTLRARWYDPTSGHFRVAAEGILGNDRARVFVPPVNNDAGDSDWVLLLEVIP
jgi:hypothetical protein